EAIEEPIPELEDLVTSPEPVEDAKPLPLQEFEPEFVAEDKEPEPVDIPDEKELGKKKPEKTVSYVPVGKEEEIRLDDES
ncbi:MAG: hypothetical protein LKJ96_07105, partial [Sphaerochaeta sp.]|nr:hypothetical protein [Sphaerochaeta sp.]